MKDDLWVLMYIYFNHYSKHFGGGGDSFVLKHNEMENQ